MKYPIDAITTENLIGQLIVHERAQRQIIIALSALLKEAMDSTDDDGQEWYAEAKAFLKAQIQLKNDHDTRLFNEKNGHAPKNEQKLTPELANKNYQNTMPQFGLGQIEDAETHSKLNASEAKMGSELSEEDLENMFNKSEKKKKKDESKPVEKMTLEEIHAWEAAQNNSNDIYKVKARVANLARGGGGKITPVGEMMVNTFVHVLMDLYAFAETVEDKSLRIRFIEKIRKHENMPGILIDAAKVGVRVKSENK